MGVMRGPVTHTTSVVGFGKTHHTVMNPRPVGPVVVGSPLEGGGYHLCRGMVRSGREHPNP